MSVENFSTSDYGLTAFLLASGFDLRSTEAIENQVVFYFSSSPTLLTAISDYTSNSPIPCRDYFHALHRTKALIREKSHEYRKHHAR
jgi:hypothetical protein